MSYPAAVRGSTLNVFGWPSNKLGIPARGAGGGAVGGAVVPIEGAVAGGAGGGVGIGVTGSAAAGGMTGVVGTGLRYRSGGRRRAQGRWADGPWGGSRFWSGGSSGRACASS